MPAKSAIADLERNVERYYQKYSASRVAVAAMSVGILSLLVALAAYWLSGNPFVSAAGFAASGLVAVNLVMFTIVPPSAQLNASQRFLLCALENPKRIKEAQGNKVRLADDHGKVRMLSGFEQRVWQTLVVPYYIKMSAGEAVSSGRSSVRSELSSTERKDLVRQRAELSVMEQKIKKERVRLEREHSILELRTAELKEAENMVIDRLNCVERAEAEIEQLREDMQAAAGGHASVDADTLRAKEAALSLKERELEKLHAQLTTDRRAVDAQKAELGRLRTRTPFSHEKLRTAKTDEERERILNARIRELESAAQELEERSRYVDEVENSLISRLNQLSEREASVEQGEINAGVREEA